MVLKGRQQVGRFLSAQALYLAKVVAGRTSQPGICPNCCDIVESRLCDGADVVQSLADRGA